MAFFIWLLMAVTTGNVELTFKKPLPTDAKAQLHRLLGKPDFDFTTDPLDFPQVGQPQLAEAWFIDRYVRVWTWTDTGAAKKPIMGLSLWLSADVPTFTFKRQPAPAR